MAGNEPQKQLLSLIRDVATQKSQGERRIENLKMRIEDLRSTINMENAELEEVKRKKEAIEQEFKGYEVELSMTEVSIQALEARIASAQGEISKAGSDLESLQLDPPVLPGCREFQALVASALNEDYVGTASTNGVCEDVSAEDDEVSMKDMEKKIAEIVSQTKLVEQEYQTELKVHEMTTEQEEKCASLGDELQRRLSCPSCHRDNSEALHDFLQAMD
ncbi:hypothetical protein M9H77_15436 [Catharanthus roseus]|uniref:Uncharacterized protein n=1 Tax=Catharanthus roseus TaxID=4058 RepID=A0ACC0B028_CATRO|nr:hypothetical protein M9H77_15436 [Catharanthus roseus]